MAPLARGFTSVRVRLTGFARGNKMVRWRWEKFAEVHDHQRQPVQGAQPRRERLVFQKCRAAREARSFRSQGPRLPSDARDDGRHTGGHRLE